MFIFIIIIKLLLKHNMINSFSSDKGSEFLVTVVLYFD